MKIIEHWYHPCEERAERRVGKNLDDEVDVEGIEDEGVVIHEEKRKESARFRVSQEMNGKRGLEQRAKYSDERERLKVSVMGNGANKQIAAPHV
jgi:hypothetical protein